MDESRRLEMRRQHAKHPHTCTCGKTVHGNGGWASHKWSCRVYQSGHHGTLDRWQHNKDRCDVCQPKEKPQPSVPGGVGAVGGRR